MKFFPGPFLRNCCLKIRHFSIKIFWPLKNIWTLSDVKSNFEQLLFSSPYWFFHSLRSYWALKFSKKYLDKNILTKNLAFSKLNSSSGSEKINIVKKTKVARNSILHQIGSSKYFLEVKIFFIQKCLIFKQQFLKKGPGKNFNFFSKLKLNNFST